MKTIIKIFIISICLLLALYQFIFAKDGIQEKFLQWQDIDRRFLVYTPSNLEEKSKHPLLVVLHGGGSKADHMLRFTNNGGFMRIARREKFIVVYPDAVNNSWNDGRAVNKKSAHIDDVGFISELIDYMIKNYNIDPTRVYVTGVSNGGFMSFRFACERGRKIAAIAPVISQMSEYLVQNTSPEVSMPVLLMNGTMDPLVPYNGGQVMVLGKARGSVLSTEDSINYWVKHNQCKTKPIVKKLQEKSKKDNCYIVKHTYTGGENSSQVVLYEVVGGGHTWPGGRQYLPVKMIGPVNKDADAAELIWDFLKNFHNSPRF